MQHLLDEIDLEVNIQTKQLLLISKKYFDTDRRHNQNLPPTNRRKASEEDRGCALQPSATEIESPEQLREEEEEEEQRQVVVVDKQLLNSCSTSFVVDTRVNNNSSVNNYPSDYDYSCLDLVSE